eukprot:jgi/Botrbrau1/18810/Bobra.0775s0001.1
MRSPPPALRMLATVRLVHRLLCSVRTLIQVLEYRYQIRYSVNFRLTAMTF